MKVYVPSHLINAVSETRVLISQSGRSVHQLTPETLQRLVMYIESLNDDDLYRLKSILSDSDIAALSEYIPYNDYHVALSKISAVISNSMDKFHFKHLFEVWQKKPTCNELIKLLSKHDVPAFRDDDFPIPEGYFSKWRTSDNLFDAVIDYIKNNSGDDTLEKRAYIAGFDIGTELLSSCYKSYFATASVSEILCEDTSTLYDILQKSTFDIQSNILIHILGFPAKQIMPKIQTNSKLFEIAKNLWRDPDSGRFPENEPTAFQNYTSWYNYYEILSAFESDYDNQRVQFWQQYIYQCKCKHIQKVEMMIMEFENYVGIEFEKMGYAYIFDKSYYEALIKPYIHYGNIKSILYQTSRSESSEHIFRRQHSGSWTYSIAQALEDRHIFPAGY